MGHTGGDVDPNFLDATAVYSMAGWILSELIRVFHNVSTQEAQEAVNSIIERKTPLIWEVGGLRRVLNPSMSSKDQVLVLLYGRPAWVDEKELLASVEYSNPSMFKTRVLKPLHTARQIEHDTKNNRARISPLGVKEVEERILKTKL